MLGPIFVAEMLRAGRRGRAHLLRWIYAIWLILQLLFYYDQALNPPKRKNALPPSSTQAVGNFGRKFLDQAFSQQFALLFLVTPGFVAGAITDEKTRGTLQGLLTAHVTPFDIVVGKLAARCIQVGVLTLTLLPLLAVVGPFGGAGPEFIVIMYLLIVLVLFGLGGLSMLASVWTKQTRNAVIATYIVLIALAMAASFIQSQGWLPTLTEWFHAAYPSEVLAPAVNRDQPMESLRRLGLAAIFWGGMGAVTTTLAIWRLRPAYVKQLDARPRGRFSLNRYSTRPKPSRDPLAWKECYIGRRIPTWSGALALAGLAAVITIGALSAQYASIRDARNRIFFAQGGWALLLSTLLVGVRCSGSITGERERQTWDGLMLSPLTAGEIVRGKLRGILKSVWPFLISWWCGVTFVGVVYTADNVAVPLLVTLAAGIVVATIRWKYPQLNTWAEYAAVVAIAASGGPEAGLIVTGSIGASWLAMYFLGSVGLWFSARSQSSWRSLLGTVVVGYLGGSVLACVAMPLLCVGMIVAMMLTEALSTSGGMNPNRRPILYDILVPLFWLMGIAGLMWLIARGFLATAESIIAKSDRIPPNWMRVIETHLRRRKKRESS